MAGLQPTQLEGACPVCCCSSAQRLAARGSLMSLRAVHMCLRVSPHGMTPRVPVYHPRVLLYLYIYP